MLPFLRKQRQVAGISTEYRKPDESKEREMDGLELAADDMLRAIATSDKKALAAALRAAFQILELEPHLEGPHEDTEEEME